MTRGISRDSFDELKQYTGVYLQQGRAILDADWNESQDIMSSLLRRVGQDALRDGVLGEGFEIQPVLPPPFIPPGRQSTTPAAIYYHAMGGFPHFLRFPGNVIDDFESADGWATPASGTLRVVRDRPYMGRGFLRLSGHTGSSLTLTKTLPAATNLSAYQFASFRFRLNQTVASTATSPAFNFFLEDQAGNRTVWRVPGVYNAKDVWAPGIAMPLDGRFHILDLDLLPAYRTVSYSSFVVLSQNNGTTVTWTQSGTLPPGVTFSSTPVFPTLGTLSGTPTTNGTYNFTLTATQSGVSSNRTFQLRVQDAPAVPQAIDYVILNQSLYVLWLMASTRMTRPTGTFADLTTIRKYGFQVFQNATNPLIWDFDALQLASRQMVNSAASNNFIISGPLQQKLTEHLLLKGVFEDAPVAGLASQPLAASTPRLYAGGMACTLARDTLYSEQADPGDAALAPPGSGTRKDLVYLDVWREPVTYVEDPDIREVALGGPDTSTRFRIRQRVRVSAGGTLPTGDGIGLGTLATEGTYTDKGNRLYLVEVDTAGDIGTATIRWSDDNASTIQRVIESVTAGSTKVKVEDASSFQVGNFVLLRKENTDEQHQIAGIFGNVITLQAAVVGTFAAADRPKLQRWNAFKVSIAADPADPPLSAAINLSHGVKVRFGGKAMRRGDQWMFRARYLAGDAVQAIDPAARIEILDFQRARGVAHHYTPLAQLIRDGGAHDVARIKVVRDRRRRAGDAVSVSRLRDLTSLLSTPSYAGGVDLGPTSDQSSFLCLWTGTTSLSSGSSAVAATLRLRFYGNDMTDPSAQPDTGKVKEVSATFSVDSTTPRQQSLTLFVPGVVTTDTPTEITAAHVMIGAGAIAVNLTGMTLQILEIRNQVVTAFDILPLSL